MSSSALRTKAPGIPGVGGPEKRTDRLRLLADLGLRPVPFNVAGELLQQDVRGRPSSSTSAILVRRRAAVTGCPSGPKVQGLRGAAGVAVSCVSAVSVRSVPPTLIADCVILALKVHHEVGVSISRRNPEDLSGRDLL